MVRDIVARWLTDEGYGCAKAATAEEAWEHLQHHEVHLVTLDIHLPGRSGVDLLLDIKRTYPDTAVIMLTAVGQTEAAIGTLTQGAWGYLLKPVDRQELLFEVNSSIERRQLTIEKREYTRNLQEKVREQTISISLAHEETIHLLVGASMYRDEETGAHIKRTGLFSEALAEAAGWSAQEAEMIRLAAPMHDVGKIGIPDRILRKPAKLTPEEFEVMKTHTVIGANMLAGFQSTMLRMAQDIALNHHERWDGKGYPAGIAGRDIPESARILAIVDVYDALCHDRPYRPALPEDEVLAIMEQGLGSHFDPRLCASFFSVLPEIRRIAEENPEEPSSDLVHAPFAPLPIAIDRLPTFSTT